LKFYAAINVFHGLHNKKYMYVVFGMGNFFKLHFPNIFHGVKLFVICYLN